MARRTKEDALATRTALLDAAERVFLEKGVAGTSLHDIATAAGTTRGAIYWHFRDKADLFNAMMDRVILPLAASIEHVEPLPHDDPLPALKQGLQIGLRRMVEDPQIRRVFEVATHKVEYVDSLCAIRERRLTERGRWIERFRQALLRSAGHRGVRLPMPAAAAAHGLQALVDGLIQSWLLDPDAFELESTGIKAIEAYLRGLGLE